MTSTDTILLFSPFNSLSITLGPLSQKLLLHCKLLFHFSIYLFSNFRSPIRSFTPLTFIPDHNSYSMNSIAINPKGDFFSQARTDPVILHSILHLVALHHDLRLKIIDSPESLYHGSEAFKMINERLEYGIFTDMTIAAVGMLVTKEVRLPLHPHSDTILNAKRTSMESMTSPRSTWKDSSTW